jgi:hypothetical protein
MMAIHFSAPSGHLFARELIKTRTPKPVHNYIVEGACKVLNGVHVLSVVKTGGGKHLLKETLCCRLSLFNI